MPIREANIAMTWDDTQLVRRLARTENQMLYGVTGALRRAILRLQKAEFAHVERELTIRKKPFFFGTPSRPGGAAGRITAFPAVLNKLTGNPRLYAELALMDATKTHNSILPLLETAGTRVPFTPGAKHSAAPITGRPARPSRQRGVPPQYTFAGLAFKGYRRGRLLKRKRRGKGAAPETVFGEFGRLQRSQLALGGVQWKGKERTFILLHSKLAPEGGVFQRIGPGRGDVRMIYAFLKPFTLPRHLHWLNVAESLGPVFLHDEIEAAMIDVVQHNAAKA